MQHCCSGWRLVPPQRIRVHPHRFSVVTIPIWVTYPMRMISLILYILMISILLVKVFMPHGDICWCRYEGLSVLVLEIPSPSDKERATTIHRVR